MPRFVYLLGCGLAAVTLAFTVTYQLVTPTPGMTLENARRIRPGMPLRQLEQVLGPVEGEIGFGRPGEPILKSWAELEAYIVDPRNADKVRGFSMVVQVEEAFITLGVGPDGRVVEVAVGNERRHVSDAVESPLSRLGGWFGR